MNGRLQPLVADAVATPLPPGGRDWLDQARRENMTRFAELGVPDKRVEGWKYTALRALAQRRFAWSDDQAGTRVIDTAILNLPVLAGPRLVFVNGVFRADLSVLSDLPPGLTLQPLAKALESDPDPLRFALSRCYRAPEDAFACLNAARSTDGVMLHVAPRVKIAVPVALVFMGADADNELAWHLRNVIMLGESACLTLVEHHVGQGTQRQLGTLVTDLNLCAQARLEQVLVQEAASGMTLVHRHALHLGPRAHARLHALALSGTLVRHDVKADLAGVGARLDTRGVFMSRWRQHMDIQLAICHQARDTKSSALWRGVADDDGRGVFRGAIAVAPGADGVDASLSNKNLLLSATAEIDTKPELDIRADEVSAAHGATVGQPDQQMLFYLRSRGVTQHQALSLLIGAFCHEALVDLPDPVLEAHCAALLKNRLPLSDQLPLKR